MPVKTGKDSQGCFAQWGDNGKKYYFSCDDEKAQGRAKQKAYIQGYAATGGKGEEIEHIVFTGGKPAFISHKINTKSEEGGKK